MKRGCTPSAYRLVAKLRRNACPVEGCSDGLSNPLTNQLAIQTAGGAWQMAVSMWKDALTKTADPSRIARLKGKIAPGAGITCKGGGCRANGTKFLIFNEKRLSVDQFADLP